MPNHSGKGRIRHQHIKLKLPKIFTAFWSQPFQPFEPSITAAFGMVNPY
ncbi:hypothetical protein WKK05_11115 [Nostoc sp. UHCC 0302]